jgi:hypothetical protein
MEKNFKRIFGVYFFYVAFFFPSWIAAQNFDKTKYEKQFFYQLGVGVGNFFPDEPGSDVNSKLVPSLSAAFGKRVGRHFGLKSTVSIQPFLVEKPTEPFKGLSYAMDLMPTVNLFPTRTQLDQPRTNAELGMGVGYLMNYVSKDYSVGSRQFKGNYLEFSPYVPIRLSIHLKYKKVTNLGIEGVFFNTWLGPEKETLYEIKKNANQFGQINLVMRRFLF